jgi:CheY-like chemotaxis protein
MAATRVMVVEDERIVALNIKRRLLQLGYEVPAYVSSGAQALAKIEHACPDVVLMDIHIDGDMDGIETAAQIPPELQIPVIYLTAYSGDDTLQRARATKPDGYLLKPFSERELHATIQMAIARRAEGTQRATDSLPTPPKPVENATVTFVHRQSADSAVSTPPPSPACLTRMAVAADAPSTRWGSGMRADPSSARAKLLDIARTCYQHRGIANTTVTDIAQAAKVTRQTVYRYFDSHTDILNAVIRRELNELWDDLHGKIDNANNFGDYLVELLINILARAQDRQPQEFLFAPTTLPALNEILLSDEGYLQALLEFLQPDYERLAGRDTETSTLDLLALCEWFNRILASYLERPSLLFPSEQELRDLLHRWLPALKIPA